MEDLPDEMDLVGGDVFPDDDDWDADFDEGATYDAFDLTNYLGALW